uniref:Membrane protein insertion efficiency factor YidD n=1 Tax=Candidatus Aschnera chinzeii TaxID=1485666 RepID=A0AAT9G5H3_9ENTR|nr:MAG: membrane protein insertion efficiency factor YidD [Candidatus Aschnera chinzeii]
MIGPCCRFYPTCSIYGMEVLQKFGLFNGLWLLIKRLLKCNSMSVGGYDPIPLYKIKKYHKRENN